MSGGARLALFDLDNTLLSGDTDQLWCAFLIEAGILDRATFAAADRDIAERYALGTIGAAEFCAFYASTLAGRTAADWMPLRDRFLAAEIAPRLPAAAHALVAKHRDAGDTVVLTTATNRFLVEPIAALLGIDAIVATELEGIDGVFTGRNAGILNMGEGKRVRMHAWLVEHGLDADSLGGAVFYSDSRNDLPLLRAVGRPVAVDPDDGLRAEALAQGWEILALVR